MLLLPSDDKDNDAVDDLDVRSKTGRCATLQGRGVCLDSGGHEGNGRRQVLHSKHCITTHACNGSVGVGSHHGKCFTNSLVGLSPSHEGVFHLHGDALALSNHMRMPL